MGILINNQVGRVRHSTPVGWLGACLIDLTMHSRSVPDGGVP